MNKRASTRRTWTRRPRRVYVTTHIDEQSTTKLARILTSAALGQAQREAAAENDYVSRATNATDSTLGAQAEETHRA